MSSVAMLADAGREEGMSEGCHGCDEQGEEGGEGGASGTVRIEDEPGGMGQAGGVQAQA